MLVNPVKYSSSLKVVMVWLSLNTFPKFLTAAASWQLSSPSPSVSQFSTQRRLTSASANSMIVGVKSPAKRRKAALPFFTSRDTT